MQNAKLEDGFIGFLALSGINPAIKESIVLEAVRDAYNTWIKFGTEENYRVFKNVLNESKEFFK